MKKIYEYEYDHSGASVRLWVDTEKFTAEMALATLNFFAWDWDKEADPIDEVMKKYAYRCFLLATMLEIGVYGVTEAMKREEGYGPVDGSIGVRLLQVEGYEFDIEFLELTKQEDL